MLNDGTLDESKHAKALATIDRNAVAMAQLVDDLLDVSRIISGKLRIDTQPTALAPIVDAAIESVKPAANAKDVTIRTNLEDASPVMGDGRRLQQIIWNLLSNAVKFTPRGGRVEVSVVRSDSNLELRVSDTGRGIEPSFLPFVFDRFRQQDASFTRTTGGLGLGLAITRHLVELHGGTIDAESEGKDRGAKFTIRLPIAAVGASRSVPTVVARQVDAIAGRARHDIERPSELQGKKVLVVDDDEDARNLVATVLTSCGCEVSTASSVGEAMVRFDDMKPDVVVSDIGMPNEDGFELIKRIRARPAERGGRVPAAALTAYARAEDRKKVLAAGFVTHVVKPVDPSELVAVIASLVRFT
jgi:CheY-like chemotaxis protein/two-component sensor histidine kinase